jgi:hypothetical protein
MARLPGRGDQRDWRPAATKTTKARHGEGRFFCLATSIPMVASYRYQRRIQLSTTLSILDLSPPVSRTKLHGATNIPLRKTGRMSANPYSHSCTITVRLNVTGRASAPKHNNAMKP